MRFQTAKNTGLFRSRQHMVNFRYCYRIPCESMCSYMLSPSEASASAAFNKYRITWFTINHYPKDVGYIMVLSIPISLVHAPDAQISHHVLLFLENQGRFGQACVDCIPVKIATISSLLFRLNLPAFYSLVNFQTWFPPNFSSFYQSWENCRPYGVITTISIYCFLPPFT